MPLSNVASCSISLFVRTSESARADNPEGHAYAQAAFEIEQEQKRNTNFLLSNLPRLATTDDTLKRFVNKKGLKPIKLMQELAGKPSVSDVQPRGYFGLALFERLTDHLYVSVWTEEKRTHMEADAVPNRHAAVHGLVVYRSFKNSLNTLFMTDYVFQIIDAIKKSASEV